MDNAISSTAPEPPGPRCRFCGAPWSDRMLDHLFAVSAGGACDCCPSPTAGRWPFPAPKPEPEPSRDLACDACGRVLYALPPS